MTQVSLIGQIANCFAILNKNDKRYLIYIVGIQVCIGLFDLIGIALMGVVGALAISGVQSQSPSKQVGNILNLLKLDGLQFQSQIFVLVTITAGLLILKTFFSLYFSRRIVFYLSLKGASISSQLIQRVAELPLSDIKRYSEQSLLFSISAGVNVVLIGIIGAICNLVTDLSLLIMLSVALFVIDPLIAWLSLLLFGVTALALYVGTRRRALKFGKINSDMNIASNTAILNLFDFYRELTVRNRKSHYVQEIAVMRIGLARAIAEINFLPNLSKYIMEITLVLGGFLILGVGLLTQDAISAAGALAVFLTAATRITPALLRVQQSATGIKSALGMAAPTLCILQEISRLEISSESPPFGNLEDRGVIHEIELQNVTFKYFDSNTYAIENLSLFIDANEMVAIVGPSGSGKSTFVDLLLGVVKPLKGEIYINGVTNSTAMMRHDLKVGYVPQNVSIIEGSLRDNLTFGFASDDFDEHEIWQAIEAAELKAELISLGFTLETRLGAGGQNMSGGQKQRLGIARALLEHPRILVLDEATSALDSETERKLNQSIQKMKGTTTLIVIAHRLSSVMNADRVLYFNNGKVLASGSFQEVRSSVADFDIQAKLLGL